MRRALDHAPLLLVLALWASPASAQKSNPCAGVKCPLNASCHATETGHACVCNRGYFADTLQATVCLGDGSADLLHTQLQQASAQAKTGTVMGFTAAGLVVASEVVFWASAAKAVSCMFSSGEDCRPYNPLHAVYGLHASGMALLTMGMPVAYLAQTRALRISGTKPSRALTGFRAAMLAAYALSMASFALWFLPEFGYIAPILGEVFTLATTVFGIVGWTIAGNIARKAIDDPRKAGPVIAPAMVPLHGGMMLGVVGTF